jgi:hypothetical protein
LSLSWKSAQPPQTFVADLAPPVVVVRNMWSRMQWLAVGTQAICKDLALPFILALVAAAFEARNAREREAREKREVEEKNEREEKERKDDRLRETWALMLEKHHQNAELYYLPLLGSMREFRRARGDGDDDRAFYFFMVFFWRMFRLSTNIGGFYFKNRSGERLLGDTWRLIVSQTDIELQGRAKREIAVEKLTTRNSAVPATYAGFSSALARKKPFQSMRVDYTAWQTKPSRATLTFADIEALLWFFHTLMAFETNRPYEYWYGDKPEFPTSDVDAFVRMPLAAHPMLAEFREHLEDYHTGIERDLKVSAVNWPWQAP